MKHPLPECNDAQRAYLARCKAEDRRSHELMFMVGNATYVYHQKARQYEPTVKDWEEWLSGLDEPIKRGMKEKGFESCGSVLSFNRYVNEKNDLGLEAFVKDKIGETHWNEYQQMLNSD